MFSSKNKKNGSSKKLTEAEIKRKLYGEFDSVSEGSHSSSHEVKMTGTAFESDSKQQNLPYGNTAVADKPKVAAPSISNTKPLPSKKPAKPSIDWNKLILKSLKTSAGFIAGLLWKLGTYLIKGLDFVLRLLDPRKPQARKLLYSITACVLVAALFIGVFRLNNQRKQAMLGERPTGVAEVVTPKPVQPVSVVAAPSATVTEVQSSSIAAAEKEESQEQILKALENSAAQKPVAEEVTSPVVEATVGKYVIQVATYALAKDAERIVDQLKQSGFESFYKEQIRNSTGRTFFTVCLGRFQSYSVAQESLAKFRKNSVARPFQDAFIRTMEA